MSEVNKGTVHEEFMTYSQWLDSEHERAKQAEVEDYAQAKKNKGKQSKDDDNDGDKDDT